MNTQPKKATPPDVSITTSYDELSGAQMFMVTGMPVLTLYHKANTEAGVPGMSAPVLAYAAVHGMKQRIVDKAAIGFLKEQNRYAGAKEKYEAMKELVEYYNAGATEWDMVGGISEGSMLFRALMREKPDRKPERIKEWMKQQDEAAKKGGDGAPKKGWRKDLLESDRLIEIVRAIRKEDGKAIDADKMLDALDA